MWLQYGVDEQDQLIAIGDVPSGKTQLSCPYCGEGLTAKKGRIKEHHFAHTGETCRPVAQRDSREVPTLPLFDKFHLHLSGKELELLIKLWTQYGQTNCSIPYTRKLASLECAGLLKENSYRTNPGYEFTKLGKIPVGALSLMLFNEVQEPLILEKLETLDREVRRALLTQTSDLEWRLTDLRIYRAQFKRVLSQTLYFLEIDAEGQTLFKVGVTSRPVEARVAEVRQELHTYLKNPIIKILVAWSHRGNVEHYFKHRYKSFNYPIGSLTEYYKFDVLESAKAGLRDLRRMKPKVLSQIEKDILSGKPSEAEEAVLMEQKAQQRSDAIRVGMERAALWGAHIGRPAVAESIDTFLSKNSSVRAIEALKRGLSLRVAAKEAGVSVNTVRKVKEALTSFKSDTENLD